MEDKLLKNQQRMSESCQFEDGGLRKVLQPLTIWAKNPIPDVKAWIRFIEQFCGTDKLYIYYIKPLQDLFHLHISII